MRLQRAQVTWSQLRVGIFVLVCAAILLWVALFAGSGLKAFQNRFIVKTVLDSASGLKPGDPVRLAGIEVGTVKKLEFIPQAGKNRVQIQINMNQQAAQYLRNDSIVQIKSVGFTESRYVEISLGTSKGEPVSEGTTLAGIAPTEVPYVLDRAIEVSENLDSFLASFESLVQQLQTGEGTFAKLVTDSALYANLNRAVTDVSGLTEGLNEGNGVLPHLISDETLAENVTQSTAWAAKWGRQVTQGEGTLGKLSTDPVLFDQTARVLKSLEGLDARLDHLDSLIASMNAVFQKMDQGQGTAAQIVNNPDLYHQSYATAKKMEQFIDQAQSGEGTVSHLVSDAALAKQVTDSAQSVAALTKKLNTPGNTLDKLATGSDLLDHLLTTTRQMESILSKINEGDGSLGKLTNDGQTAENLSQLIARLKALAADIQAHPKKYMNFSLF